MSEKQHLTRREFIQKSGNLVALVAQGFNPDLLPLPPGGGGWERGI